MTGATLRMTSLVAALALLLGAGAAQAEPTIVTDGSGDFALQIRGLEVDGDLFDVTFVHGDASAVYGPEPQDQSEVYELIESLPFDGGAAQAANAEMAALLDAEGILGVTSTGYESYDLAVTFALPGGTDRVQATTIGAATPEVIPCDDSGLGGCEPEIGPPGSWGIYLKLEDPIGIGGEPEEKPDKRLVNYDEVITWARFDLASGSDPLPIGTFSASPTLIESGDDSTLSWSVQNATSCTGSGGSGSWPGDKDPVSGSEMVSPTETTTYTLSCSGLGGTRDTQVTVNVEESQNFPTDPIDVGTSGMVDVTPSVSTRYRLTCDGPGGQTTEEVTVTVPEPGAALAMLAALAGLGVVRRTRQGP